MQIPRNRTRQSISWKNAISDGPDSMATESSCTATICSYLAPLLCTENYSHFLSVASIASHTGDSTGSSTSFNPTFSFARFRLKLWELFWVFRSMSCGFSTNWSGSFHRACPASLRAPLTCVTNGGQLQRVAKATEDVRLRACPNRFSASLGWMAFPSKLCSLAC